MSPRRVQQTIKLKEAKFQTSKTHTQHTQPPPSHTHTHTHTRARARTRANTLKLGRLDCKCRRSALCALSRYNHNSEESARLKYPQMLILWRLTMSHVCVLWPYGVVPKGLLSFLGSLYKEVAKTTFGTLVYRFERQTARKKLFPSKNTMSSIWNVGFYLRNLRIAAFRILMSYFMESKLEKTSTDSWWHVNAVIIETVEALETRYSIILSGSNVIF